MDETSAHAPSYAYSGISGYYKPKGRGVYTVRFRFDGRPNGQIELPNQGAFDQFHADFISAGGAMRPDVMNVSEADHAPAKLAEAAQKGYNDGSTRLDS